MYVLRVDLKVSADLQTFYTHWQGIPQFWSNKGESSLPISFKMAVGLY